MRFLEIGESFLSPNDKSIAPLVLGGIIAAGASLAGNAIGAASNNKTNQTSIDINRENNRFNAEQAQIQRDWQEKMWGMNNSYNSPHPFPSACSALFSFTLSAILKSRKEAFHV